MATDKSQAGTASTASTTATTGAPTATDAAAPRRHRARKIGTVVSAKMQKTVVVEVSRTVRHERYGRFRRRSERFLADDRVLGCKTGDVVEIEETRPLSAKKRWRVKAIVTKGRGVMPERIDAVPAS